MLIAGIRDMKLPYDGTLQDHTCRKLDRFLMPWEGQDDENPAMASWRLGPTVEEWLRCPAPITLSRLEHVPSAICALAVHVRAPLLTRITPLATEASVMPRRTTRIGCCHGHRSHHSSRTRRITWARLRGRRQRHRPVMSSRSCPAHRRKPSSHRHRRQRSPRPCLRRRRRRPHRPHRRSCRRHWQRRHRHRHPR